MENAAASFDPTPWIAHLENPLVLFGFALFVMAGLLKLFRSDKLSGKGTERLMDKGLSYAFVIAVLVIILGFALSLQDKAPKTTVKQESNGLQSGNRASHVPSGANVDQKSTGTQSPNQVEFGK